MTMKTGLIESAKEILAANVANKQASGEPMPKYSDNPYVDIGNGAQELDDKNIDPTKGVPNAEPPGEKPAEDTKQKTGVGAEKPDEEDSDANVDDDKVAGQSVADIVNRVPVSVKQTFDVNKGAIPYDGKADLQALFKGESLSPEFKEKVCTIFEAAVGSRVDAILDEILVDVEKQFDEAVELHKEEMYEQMDEYLSEMVKQWSEENSVALEQNIRTELAEEFIDKLKTLFTESYIDIPEDKVDVVNELASKVDTLTNNLNEQIETNLKLSKIVTEQCKKEILHIACEGLTLVQQEKLKSLAENISTSNLDEFESKVATLKEAYFDSEKSVKKDGTIINEQYEGDSSPKVTNATGDYFARLLESYK